MRWKIKGYEVRAGESVIDDWMAIASRAAEKFDSRLNFMKDRRTWPHHYAHNLNDCDGVWEVKFESGGIAHRPLFFMGPGRDELTFVGFAIEHNDRLKPPGILATAIRRMKEIVESPEKAIDYDG
ncbi:MULTISPECIES: hypothetical protein [unclassified Mesorhizobium]|uniref:hypothetical protein n=1 Tax=unclassified Mesorhizobium TaxID=325217 RepID=UPI000BAE83D8|nr:MULTISPECIES: hypothetical protein [unclassified Mesorhizobium]PBC23450.1 hypothetical protein CK226_09985 [Mesorhizobium sp. WSM4311]TRD06816.1 hypothetical protein FJV82_08785 [Mesorhizobium sp. WSM4305]